MNQQLADVIISSNAVFTGLYDQPEPASIAIKDNKIISIGSGEEVKSYSGENTKIYQFNDQLIIPGFHDFHLHMMDGAVSMNSANLFSARSEEEALEMIREFAESRPEDPWIIGSSWDAGYWDTQQLPNRHSLDRILPDRPVLMFHAEGHYAWVNSKALEIANITLHTENPSYGIIGKDETGEPNGLLYEKAMDAVILHAYDFTKEQKRVLFTNFLAHAASLGVTSVHDLFAIEALEMLNDYDVFKEFEDNGELTAHSFMASFKWQS
ncbi:putative amidohydrolase YtcJ [Peribacillus sp. V2I11]|nr:putative amidohydrolase YtcJ [Peribacillus sp. V2I11]